MWASASFGECETKDFKLFGVEQGVDVVRNSGSMVYFFIRCHLRCVSPFYRLACPGMITIRWRRNFCLVSALVVNQHLFRPFFISLQFIKISSAYISQMVGFKHARTSRSSLKGWTRIVEPIDASSASLFYCSLQMNITFFTKCLDRWLSYPGDLCLFEFIAVIFFVITLVRSNITSKLTTVSLLKFFSLQYF